MLDMLRDDNWVTSYHLLTFALYFLLWYSLEYIVSKIYFEKYIKLGDRILEVGAGTGAYSLYYANKGYKVNAIEFVQDNLDILKSKITDNMAIIAKQGDAVDLSGSKNFIQNS